MYQVQCRADSVEYASHILYVMHQKKNVYRHNTERRWNGDDDEEEKRKKRKKKEPKRKSIRKEELGGQTQLMEIERSVYLICFSVSILFGNIPWTKHVHFRAIRHYNISNFFPLISIYTCTLIYTCNHAHIDSNYQNFTILFHLHKYK